MTGSGSNPTTSRKTARASGFDSIANQNRLTHVAALRRTHREGCSPRVEPSPSRNLISEVYYRGLAPTIRSRPSYLCARLPPTESWRPKGFARKSPRASARSVRSANGWLDLVNRLIKKRIYQRPGIA